MFTNLQNLFDFYQKKCEFPKSKQFENRRLIYQREDGCRFLTDDRYMLNSNYLFSQFRYSFSISSGLTHSL